MTVTADGTYSYHSAINSYTGLQMIQSFLKLFMNIILIIHGHQREGMEGVTPVFSPLICVTVSTLELNLTC